MIRRPGQDQVAPSRKTDFDHTTPQIKPTSTYNTKFLTESRQAKRRRLDDSRDDEDSDYTPPRGRKQSKSDPHDDREASAAVPRPTRRLDTSNSEDDLLLVSPAAFGEARMPTRSKRKAATLLFMSQESAKSSG